MVQGVFGNVVGGTVLLGNNIPFTVTYSSTAVTLTATAIRDDDRVEQHGRHDQSRPAGHVHGDGQRPHSPGHDRDRHLRAGEHGPGDRRARRRGDGVVHHHLPAAGGYVDHRGVQRDIEHPRLDQPDPDAVRRPVHDRDEPGQLGRPQPHGPARDLHGDGHRDGQPVTNGTVAFTRGNKLLGPSPWVPTARRVSRTPRCPSARAASRPSTTGRPMICHPPARGWPSRSTRLPRRRP